MRRSIFNPFLSSAIVVFGLTVFHPDLCAREQPFFLSGLYFLTQEVTILDVVAKAVRIEVLQPVVVGISQNEDHVLHVGRGQEHLHEHSEDDITPAEHQEHYRLVASNDFLVGSRMPQIPVAAGQCVGVWLDRGHFRRKAEQRVAEKGAGERPMEEQRDEPTYVMLEGPSVLDEANSEHHVEGGDLLMFEGKLRLGNVGLSREGFDCLPAFWKNCGELGSWGSGGWSGYRQSRS